MSSKKLEYEFIVEGINFYLVRKYVVYARFVCSLPTIEFSYCFRILSVRIVERKNGVFDLLGILYDNKEYNLNSSEIFISRSKNYNEYLYGGLDSVVFGV